MFFLIYSTDGGSISIFLAYFLISSWIEFEELMRLKMPEPSIALTSLAVSLAIALSASSLLFF
jgi:hypothetical protein